MEALAAVLVLLPAALSLPAQPQEAPAQDAESLDELQQALDSAPASPRGLSTLLPHSLSQAYSDTAESACCVGWKTMTFKRDPGNITGADIWVDQCREHHEWFGWDYSHDLTRGYCWSLSSMVPKECFPLPDYRCPWNRCQSRLVNFPSCCSEKGSFSGECKHQEEWVDNPQNRVEFQINDGNSSIPYPGSEQWREGSLPLSAENRMKNNPQPDK